VTVDRAAPHRANPPPWRDIRVLRATAQLIALIAVLGAGYLLWSTFSANLAASRLTVDLDFMRATAGFDISQTIIAYSPRDSYAQAFLAGLLNTLMVSVVGIILATALGIVVGVARLSSNWLVNRIAAGYVEIMRNTPLLVQLVLIYAVLLLLPTVANSIAIGDAAFLNQRGLFMPRPVAREAFGPWLVIIAGGLIVAMVAARFSMARQRNGLPAYGLAKAGLAVFVIVTAVGWTLLQPVEFDVPVRERFNFIGGVVISPPFTALLFGLVIYTAAFIGEVVRGGIQAVRRGQIEAAYAIGLRPGQTLRLVVFPQALRIIVPPLTSQYLNLAKNSSLAIAVGFPDLFSVSRTIGNQTGQPVAVILLVMATYLTISLVTSLLMNIYNRRVQVLER
jgi:general L-amino acid transport system permease protein